MAATTSTSWVVTQSEHALQQRIQSHSKQKLIDNITSRNILPRKLKFVKPQKAINARPMTASSDDSTSSTPPKIERQSSDFKPAKIQLFEESKITQLMEWRKSLDDVGSGLRNLGNSCFMNATLQCLAYTAPFQNYIATKQHTKLCKTSGYCIFCELQKLLPTMLYNQSTAVPSTIFRNLRLLSKKLRPGRQEDAQEFLRFLMEGLQNNCLKQEGTKIKDMRIQETTFIHKLWGGYLRSQIKCCKCGYESNTYDSILDISLEIKGPSVRSAFKHFTDPEILDDDNKYNCDNCKKKRRAIKQFTIFEPPNALVIHLKRFECGGGGLFSGGKINKFVRFEDELDLTEFMSYHTCPKVSYSLFGVLVHYGYSAHGGHYVSYIKAPDNRWYLMDDSSVRSANISSVLKEKAYLLFYKRNEQKVLYQSPSQSPRMKSVIKRENRNTSINTRKSHIASPSSFDSLKELADHLPKNSYLFDKSPIKESPQLSGTKRSLMNKFDLDTADIIDTTSQPPTRKKSRSRNTSEDTTPIHKPIKSESSLYSKKRNIKPLLHSLNSNNSNNSMSISTDHSSEDLDIPMNKHSHSYHLRKTAQRQKSKDRDVLEWQKDGKDGNGDDLESDCKTSSEIIILSASGAKRKHSMDDEDEDSIDQPRISPKKRKIANGVSMPVKTDKKSREEALRTLKQRMRWKHKRSSSISSTLSSTQSSSPKSTSTWSHPHTVNKNGSRRVSASKYTGRRSHALNLAAKSSLNMINISPRRIWNRKAVRRAAQPPTSTLQSLRKLQRGSVSPTNAAPVPGPVTFDDSSSESVLSDNAVHHKSTPFMSSEDSSGSISPQTYSPKPQMRNKNNTNTTLPSHDGSSPLTLPTNGVQSKLPKTSFTLNSNSSIPAPIHSLKNITKHKINPNQLHLKSTTKPKQKAHYISDQNLINAYLKNETSAIGVNVGSWSDEADNGQELRQKLIEQASEPLVPEKDEWDVMLDTGTAYPHKSKQKSDPFKDFNRDEYVNKFQTVQVDGKGKQKRERKKKGKDHNKNRYINRKQKHSVNRDVNVYGPPS